MTEEVEDLLAQALVPVEPPVSLRSDLTSRLQAITESAQDELEGWEISAMKDPRNWVRPVAAAVIGTAAGTALIVIEVRAAHRQRVSSGESLPLSQLAGKTVRSVGSGVRQIKPTKENAAQLRQTLAEATGKLALGERFDAARRSLMRQ